MLRSCREPVYNAVKLQSHPCSSGCGRSAGSGESLSLGIAISMADRKTQCRPRRGLSYSPSPLPARVLAIDSVSICREKKEGGGGSSNGRRHNLFQLRKSCYPTMGEGTLRIKWWVACSVSEWILRLGKQDDHGPRLRRVRNLLLRWLTLPMLLLAKDFGPEKGSAIKSRGSTASRLPALVMRGRSRGFGPARRCWYF